jgi:rhamnogalacturonyl hydrolase YesR
MAMVEFLSELPADHPDRTQLLSILEAHADGLRRVQATSGLWNQLLNRPDSYEETSSSGMYVFAIARAINAGWLSPTTYGRVVLRGWDGVTTKVNSTGQVGRGHLWVTASSGGPCTPCRCWKAEMRFRSPLLNASSHSVSARPAGVLGSAGC